jgi:predicted DNA-binding transcriptional regulator YafY
MVSSPPGQFLLGNERLPQPVTAARLAEESGVSLRTLYRDIATLRLGGALIDGEAGLGYTLTEDPALPPQMFTQVEVEALVLGLSEVRQMGDPALATAAEAAMAKITATLPERVQRQAIHAVSRSYRFDKPPAAPGHVALVRTSCWQERALDITFTDVKGEVTRRRIYLETMEAILGNVDKILLDPSIAGGAGGQGVVPFLPLNELMRPTAPAAAAAAGN